jgi:hypothetical protein
VGPQNFNFIVVGHSLQLRATKEKKNPLNSEEKGKNATKKIKFKINLLITQFFLFSNC